MSMSPLFRSDEYEDGRTKQSFKDSTDINMILARAARGETISHLNKYEAVYGDYTDIPDLLTANERLQKAQAIFDELPSELRREFKNSVSEFFAYVNDPANMDDLERKLPALAKPGQQLPEPRRTPERMAGLEDPAPEGQPEPPPAAPAAGSPTE